MHTATLVASTPAGTDLTRLVFAEPAEGHIAPGQFVQVTVGDTPPAYFALANPPGASIELLIKRTPGSAAAQLADLALGARVPVTSALGGGFPLDRVAGLPLVLLVNGSGLSAARPVVLAEIAAGLTRSVTLYLGVLSPDRTPLADELGAWQQAGVTVKIVVDAGYAGDWAGPRGFVQHAAHADGLVRGDVGVVLVGVPGMIATARELWLAAGAPAEHLLTNY